MSEMEKSHFDKLIEIKEKGGMKSSKFLRKKSSVLMLSGGIDSVAGLKYLLVETDKLLYVHHIHLKNDEGIEYSRYKKEAEAVRKIVPYMKKTFRNFNYTESTIDVRQIVGLLPDYYEEEDFSLANYFVIDRSFWSLIAGTMSKITNSNEIYIGSCLEDFTDVIYNDYEISIEDQIKFISNPTLSAASYPHETPISHPVPCNPELTKRQSIEYIGKKLMNMVWYCRQPIEKNGEFIVCHECKSCKHVDNALSEKIN